MPQSRVLSRFSALTICSLLVHLPGVISRLTQRSGLADTPAYSAKATIVYRGKAAASPDGKKKVTIDLLEEATGYHPASVIVETLDRKLLEKIQFGLGTEVLWSPDSEAFTVTGSIEGANGLYEANVFYVRGDRLARVNVTPLVRRVFGHPVKCGWPELPNVGVIKWLVPSHRLLVAAEIIHHSNCDSFGTFRAYAIDVPRSRIVKVYDQLETKALYTSDLGKELLQANDECIRNPPSCYMVGNHPEMNSGPH